MIVSFLYLKSSVTVSTIIMDDNYSPEDHIKVIFLS